MSYDLWFWKQSENCKTQPGEVANNLACGDSVEGLERIDISKVTQRIVQEFPEIEQHFNPDTNELRQLILDPPKEDWVVLCGWDDYHFNVESHSAPGEILNQFIEVAIEFDCPLYDPQTGTRYA